MTYQNLRDVLETVLSHVKFNAYFLLHYRNGCICSLSPLCLYITHMLSSSYQVAPRQEQESDDEDDEEGSLEEAEGEDDNEKDTGDKKTEKEKKREEYGKDEEDIAEEE